MQVNCDLNNRAWLPSTIIKGNLTNISCYHVPDNNLNRKYKK